MNVKANANRSVKADKAQKDAARRRKQKSRNAAKEAGLCRLRISIGSYERNLLMIRAFKTGCTMTDVVCQMVAEHTHNGALLVPPERGCLWDSREWELDLTVPKEVADSMHTYGKKLTPGEVLEVLIGLALNPQWNPQDNGSEMLLGRWPWNEPGVYHQMFTAQYSYFRRRDRRFLRHVAGLVAKGCPPGQALECWPDRGACAQRADKSAQAEWKHAVLTGDLTAKGHEVSGYPDMLTLKRKFGINPWDARPVLTDDPMDEAVRLEAAERARKRLEDWLDEQVSNAVGSAYLRRPRRSARELEAATSAELREFNRIEARYRPEPNVQPLQAPKQGQPTGLDYDAPAEPWQPLDNDQA